MAAPGGASADLAAINLWLTTFAGCEGSSAETIFNGVALSTAMAEVAGGAGGLDPSGDVRESNWALGASR